MNKQILKSRLLLISIVFGMLLFPLVSKSPTALAQQSKKEVPLSVQDKVKKISIELKNIDIIEVLKLLAQKGNINIVAGKDVRGKVTLFLDDVKIWDALRIIFETNSLAYVWDGEILKVITERAYEQLYGKKFHDLREVRIFQLNHAKVTELINSINQLKSKLGKVVADERTNTLLVIDLPETLKFIEETILTMDVKVTTKVFPLRFATPALIAETAKLILSKNGIIQSDAQSNKIIVTDIKKNVDKLEQIIKEYDVPPYTITKVFPLNYARYDEMEAKLKDELTPDIGILRADERTNTIIITDLPSIVARMEKVITAYDEKTREVLIEAKVVQVTLSDSFALGIDWELVLDTFRGRNLNFSLINATSDILGAPAAPEGSFLSDGVVFPATVQTVTVAAAATATNGTATAATATAAPSTATISTISTTTAAGATVTGTSASTDFFPQPGTIPFDLTTIRPPFTFPRLATGGTVVATGTINGSDAFSSALNALKQVGKVNLLSSPRITVINGEEAKIAVATREAFVTNTVVQNDTVATTAENVTFIDVGVLLSVTPTINSQNYVQMNIRPEVSAVVRTLTTAEGNVIPIVSTQEAETTLLVRDGVTVILGGLITDSRARQDSRIPIFGSLPIVGAFFRNTSYVLVKDEIVIFLTPHILSGDTTYEGSFAASIGVQKYVEEEKLSRAKEDDVVIDRNKSPQTEDLKLDEPFKDPFSEKPVPFFPFAQPMPFPSTVSSEAPSSDDLVGFLPEPDQLLQPLDIAAIKETTGQKDKLVNFYSF